MANTQTYREPNPSPALTPTLSLVFSGERAVLPAQLTVLRSGTVLLGREVPFGRGIKTDDTRLSSTHAYLHVSRDQDPPVPRVAIEDAGSKNGTFINGRRVTGALLNDGDIVQAGQSFFVYRLEPAEPLEVSPGRLLGQSPVMAALRRELARVAASPAEILLLGESGSGKELAAQTLHDLRRQQGRSGPLVAVNAAEIVETLAESELFGHRAGAFTDAKTHREGLFQKAHLGTLFLDEVGDMPFSIQAKFLRAIEQQAVRQVGSTTLQAVDVRLIAATNRDLQQGVRAGWFRGDLYMRLAGLQVTLPPLRARREDILLLFAHHCGGRCPAMTARLVSYLLLHPYPFNVRQLKKIAADLALNVSEGVPLDVDRIQDRFAMSGADSSEAAVHTEAPALLNSPEAAGFRQEPNELLRWQAKGALPPREQLEQLLIQCQGNVERTARAVGCDPHTVRRWCDKLQIDVEAIRLDAKKKL